MTHLRHADKPAAEQQAELLNIVRASPALMAAFHTARDMDLPDWWIVSGAIYNQVWNHLTGRPDMAGVKDIDLFYFDTDTRLSAENTVIERAAKAFTHDPPVEVRNQARVHLWYEDHFGEPYSALNSSCEAVDRFACQTHAVSLRFNPDDSFTVYAPYGLNDIFAFRVTPNPIYNNRKTHEAKAARQRQLWPELEVIPWPN